MSSLLDRTTRHQVYLERFKAGTILTFKPYLVQMEDALRREFSVLKVDTLDQLTKAKLNTLIATVRGLLQKAFNKYLKGILAFLLKFMRGEIDMFKSMTEGGTPEPDRLWSSILNAPLPGNGQFVETMLQALGKAAESRVTDTIYKAASNGVKTGEALAGLVGAATILFGSSALAKIGTQNAILIDTIIQHISQMVASAVASSILDTYTWVSVIDKGTTEICVSRNGDTFKYGSGPLPPAHYQCRSFTVPGDVKSQLSTFASWLKTQPANVIKDMGNIILPSPLSLDAFLSKLDLVLQ